METYGRYILERELGRGATAKIYRAKDPTTSEWVSLKIFHPKIFQDPLLSERMKREMQLARELAHPQIVQVREILDLQDPPAFVMDYIDGENLESYQGRLPYVLPELSVLIVIEILKALEYAHAKGIIHRDLKPDNVLISHDGRVLLTDFGLAKIEDATQLTQGQSILGTLDYLSPELACGDSVAAASDLFSVGTILYFLITGTRPFARATPMATLTAIRTESPEPASRRNPKVPLELVRVLNRALEKKTEDRYPSAKEFRLALEQYLADLGLENPLFTLRAWQRDSTATVLWALRTSSQRLIERAENSLKNNRWDDFLQTVGHLSLKAPETPALERLMETYEKGRRRRKVAFWFWSGLSTACLLSLVLTGFFLQNRKTKQNKLAAAPIPIAIVPSPAAPTPTPAPATPSTVKRIAAKAGKPSGKVQFNIGPEIRVFWDGKAINASEELANVWPGVHDLLLEKPGEAPIRAKVAVRPDKPTVINAD